MGTIEETEIQQGIILCTCLQCTTCTMYIVQSEAPVVDKPLYQLQGNNRIPMYFDRNWGMKRQNPVVDTGG